MRQRIITALAVLPVLLTASCKKTSYRSYQCTCIQESKGDILETREYGVQATDLNEAGVLCNDIEDRINKHNDAAGVEHDFNCKAKH